MSRPTGTVTFLFTDIEGSTRRWESDPDAMRAALARHDEVLRSAVKGHGGWLFKHTGDGVCAAFSSAPAALDTAVEAQRSLGLPVRMGIGTGEAELRGEDYSGPALNRAARVMAAGHGGQILVSASTAGLVTGFELVDLGEFRLRDLSGAHRLFQVRAEGLGQVFPALRTLDAVPGNLPVQATSFVGRGREVIEVVGLVRTHRLVTLTGVGGVGKSRLAVQVAGVLVPEFPDGVWLVELAPVGEQAAVADAVATVLGITTQAGGSMVDSVASALSRRRLLIVMDNCEHLLDAVAEFVEAILSRVTTVKVLATSREGLQVEAEQLWPVPSLDVSDGADSPAVELFVERARAVSPGFSLERDADKDAVTTICRRLDGIALAIELAAARMMSMSPQEVCDRLGDRFRLLAGSRRGLERHQTLRHAVEWSYDLLCDDERVVLQRCSVFAGDFDLAAAVAVCGGEFDEYALLDVIDSMVRKSLVTASRFAGRTRYAMLETIRQFAEGQLAATATIDQVRDRHASYFADQAMAHWNLWDGPEQRVALDWVEVEFDNLRAGYHWATGRADLVTATAIAAHTAMLAFAVQRLEPVGWAEGILDAATISQVPQLPRLYAAAARGSYLGRPDTAIGYAQIAIRLAADPRRDPFGPGWAGFLEALGHLFAGRIDRAAEIHAGLAAQTGPARLYGLCGLTMALPRVGRAEEARAIADETVSAARRHANPFWIACALYGYGQAFAGSDPARALAAWREGLVYTRAHRLPFWEAVIARESAGLEAVHGDPADALELFDSSIESFHHAGNVVHLAFTLAHLAVFFDRLDRPEVAVTLYGTSTAQHGLVALVPFVPNLPDVADRGRARLGDALADKCTAFGEGMELGDAVAYARHQIHVARTELAASS